jgi:methyl-accepting chemotaxis protein
MTIKWKLPTRAGYAAVVATGLLLAVAVYVKYSWDYAAALKSYRKAETEAAQSVAKSVEVSFTNVYTNLRTIAYLPSVRKIDRHGTNLDPDALASIQQIYNNLASAVAVSEVYVVPATLNPDVVDPVTKTNEVPILMFDELIVGGGDGGANGAAATAPADAAPSTATSGADAPAATKPEEVEIYEYHLLQRQMQWLTDTYPDTSKVKDLEVPMISGGEVITCDNTEYDKTLNDADRKGIVLSVPFYGPDNKLKGTISAIIRTNNLRAMLPQTDYALVNADYGYATTSADGGQAAASLSHAAQAETDPGLLFSVVQPLGVNDPRSHWAIWAGHPDADFLDSPDVLQIRHFSIGSYVLIALLTGVGVLVLRAGQRNMLAVRANNARLESQLGEIHRLSDEQQRMKAEADEARREGMTEIAHNFESAVHGISYAVEMLVGELATDASDLEEASQQTGARVATVADLSERASTNAGQVADAAGRLSQSIQEIGRQVMESSATAAAAVAEAKRTNATVAALSEAAGRIDTVVALISSIAGQTNLLALNATIEAARAGEAGRGFAVVASEVKSLAQQTTKATEDIAGQIAAIQAAVRESVAAIQSVGGTIERVSGVTGSVATAIEQQDRATGEIARNVQAAATGTREVVSQVGAVSKAAAQTSLVSTRVQEGAHYLRLEAGNLNKAVASLQDIVSRIRAG